MAGKKNQSQSEEHVEGGHFIVPFTNLRNVAIALLGLTFLTVATAQMHLGWAAAPIAFVIATIKALLVMAYFMGLKFDAKTNRLIFALGFVFLGVLYFFCVLDIFTRVLETNQL